MFLVHTERERERMERESMIYCKQEKLKVGK